MEMGSFPPAGVGMDHYGYLINHHHNPFQQQQPPPPPQPQPQPSRLSRKRKPDAPPEHNERLSKRMSLLNLEHSGPKLYVPVEQGDNHTPTQPLPNLNTIHHHHHGARHNKHPVDDSMMQLDDSKYKVYIYNLDDELSSSDNETDDGKLVFLPDIEKHLRSNRIPPNLLAAASSDAANKQLVLYRVPSSITVPEEQDSVRKAIIEARQRIKEKQEAERAAAAAAASPVPVMRDVPMDTGLYPAPPPSSAMEDPDAMELD
ncbi:hypothetical protein B0T21DRAFT_385360 [Apiosordaria backusii]|uniref:Uncharacterized protein n=1 Tax=Apiosordaria backusii TaxID=314023 RepID=A0AA40E5S2_9PEZI|nr:hypothetical protein B0T21DRAFT_385360 [Apiosordaria backusii]